MQVKDSMQIELQEEDTILIFHIKGNIEGPNTVLLSKKLEAMSESAFSTYVLDFSEVHNIDSCGLGGLIYSQVLLERSEKRMVLLNPQGYVRRLFFDCRLEKVMKIVSTMEELET